MRLFDLRLGERDQKRCCQLLDTNINDFNMPYMFSILCYTILTRRKISWRKRGRLFFLFLLDIPIIYLFLLLLSKVDRKRSIGR